MTKEMKKTGFPTAEMPTNTLVQTYYCALEPNVVPGSDESLGLAGRGR